MRLRSRRAKSRTRGLCSWSRDRGRGETCLLEFGSSSSCSCSLNGGLGG